MRLTFDYLHSLFSHCASAGERSGSTHYHSGIGEKNVLFVFLEPITIVLGGAYKWRMRQRWQMAEGGGV